MRLTILSRSYCHLCADLIAAVDGFRGRSPRAFEVEVIDIDGFPELEQRWGDKVPVLLAGDREICHYFFDSAALERALLAPS